MKILKHILVGLALALLGCSVQAQLAPYNSQQNYATFADADGKFYIVQNGIYYDLQGNAFNTVPQSKNGYTPVTPPLITAGALTNVNFIVPPNGTVTSGVNTLGTALDQAYTGYFYLPAGAWTSSTAGWYWTVCANTTTCQHYSAQYVSGTPVTIPINPTPIAASAAAYTQTTATYLAGPTITLAGNLLGLNGELIIEVGTSNNNTAGTKAIRSAYGGQNLTVSSATTNTGVVRMYNIVNKGVTNAQNYVVTGANASGSGASTVDTTQPQTFTVSLYLATATDFNVVQWVIPRAYK